MLSRVRELLTGVWKRLAAEAEAAPSLPEAPLGPTAAGRAGDRAALLVEAGRVLSESLDYEGTFQNLAQLVLRRFADYCLIFELLDPPAMRQVASSHVDARKEHLPRRLGEMYGVFPENPKLSLWRVARTGKSELVPHATLEMAQAVTQDAEVLAIYRRLQAVSFLVVPLAARGQTLGVMLLATAESGRVFGAEDLALAEEIAVRAGLAIDNARLYRLAQAAARAKDDFLAALSHELRAPLTPVLLTVNEMLQSHRLHESLREGLEMIERSVQLEARLIDDLLDLTRISRGQVKVHFEVRDVHRLLTDVERLCRELGQEKNVRIDLLLEASEHYVWGDAARLEQVFWKLLDNAVKFSHDGGRVEVRTSDVTHGRVRIDVTDHGLGIPPEILPRLFQPFERGVAAGRKVEGLGLGLAIAKSLVDLHGGTLAVASDGAERGSTFSVVLSTVPLPVRETRRREQPKPAQRSLRLLVVEDHAPTREVLATLLQVARHQIKTAGDIATARRLADTHVFDLVLSDLGLPDGSGLDLMIELRDRYGLEGIAVTGYGMEEDLHRSREAGFREHLVKPVTLEQLSAAIARASEVLAERNATPAAP
jgi:signal transduction histidine kinase/ActR/RegA family two-component response regulator